MQSKDERWKAGRDEEMKNKEARVMVKYYQGKIYFPMLGCLKPGLKQAPSTLCVPTLANIGGTLGLCCVDTQAPVLCSVENYKGWTPMDKWDKEQGGSIQAPALAILLQIEN